MNVHLRFEILRNLEVIWEERVGSIVKDRE